VRAYSIDQFGVPGSVGEQPAPDAGTGEILVRVRAAGVNAFDTAVVAGYVKDYMEHRFPLVPGLDASGVVEAIGEGVSGFSNGDEVVGISERPFVGAGTFAQLVALPVLASARKPSTVGYVEAAALPTAGLTALSTVEAADPKAGQTVVIIGATGGVGSFAIQLAAARGAIVVAITRGDYAAYARELGATDTIDYTAGDPSDLLRARQPDGVDVLIDFAADRELLARLADQVRTGGSVVSSAGVVDVEELAERGIRGTNANRAAPGRLAELVKLVDDGRIRVPATHTYRLEDAAAALQEQAGRHVRGKLVLDLSE